VSERRASGFNRALQVVAAVFLVHMLWETARNFGFVGPGYSPPGRRASS
jgi:hypothetical protein